MVAKKPDNQELYLLNVLINNMFHSNIFKIFNDKNIVAISFNFKEHPDYNFIVTVLENPNGIYFYRTPQQVNNFFSIMINAYNTAGSLGANHIAIYEYNKDDEYLFPKNWKEYKNCTGNHPYFNKKPLSIFNVSHAEEFRTVNSDECEFLQAAFHKLKEALDYLKGATFNENSIVAIDYDKDGALVDYVAPDEFNFYHYLDKYKEKKYDYSSLPLNCDSISLGLFSFKGITSNGKYLQMVYAVDSDYNFYYETYYTSQEQELSNMQESLNKLFLKAGKYKEYVTNNYFIYKFIERNLDQENISFYSELLTVFEDHFITGLYINFEELEVELRNIFDYIIGFNYADNLYDEVDNSEYVS